jgi:hypothetical protein
VIHKVHKKYSLSSQDRAPSLKLAHQGHSIITYKTTNKPKIEKQEIELFDILETLQLWKLCNRAELGFLLSSTKNT